MNIRKRKHTLYRKRETDENVKREILTKNLQTTTSLIYTERKVKIERTPNESKDQKIKRKILG